MAGPEKTEMSDNFYNQVYKLVKKIPPGKIATYGQVAALLGSPRSARLVGWALRNSPDDVPWQRVINRQGMISVENLSFPKELQARLLKNEGIVVKLKNGNYWVELDKYLWPADEKNLVQKTSSR